MVDGRMNSAVSIHLGVGSCGRWGVGVVAGWAGGMLGVRGACVCYGARTGGLERSAVLRGARRSAGRALGAAVGQPLARGGLAPRPRRAQPPARPISASASTRLAQT